MSQMGPQDRASSLEDRRPEWDSLHGLAMNSVSAPLLEIVCNHSPVQELALNLPRSSGERLRTPYARDEAEARLGEARTALFRAHHKGRFKPPPSCHQSSVLKFDHESGGEMAHTAGPPAAANMGFRTDARPWQRSSRYQGITAAASMAAISLMSAPARNGATSRVDRCECADCEFARKAGSGPLMAITITFARGGTGKGREELVHQELRNAYLIWAVEHYDFDTLESGRSKKDERRASRSSAEDIDDYGPEDAPSSNVERVAQASKTPLATTRSHGCR
ncbi:hypothetical protein FALBO_13885 [Fusarium albosuccineum]|uniref:Uncharacterized protein n=1 Tax=Fusarium albosuccineum TaxID=1237068 RepID=A0A8H4KY00_9HYPO|nr:hypothetical protein FALBO_13885 [Fusarium albosuccineum]